MIKNKTKKTRFLNFICIILILSLILSLVIMPEKSIITFSQGIMIWCTKILPALLPFFILTNLLSYTTFTTTIGKLLSPITQKLYGVGGVAGYIFFMSIISGYPVGAKLTADLYRNSTITSGQAISISAFTSTSGPLFVIGTVGIGFFHNQRLGTILLITHIVGALINGLFFRQKNNKKIVSLQSIVPTTNILNSSMTSSISSIMTIGGFIAIFYMILQTLLHINAFAIPIRLFERINVPSNITISIISGIIEVTSGALTLSQCQLSTSIALPILSFLVSFGGLSVHAQAYCFLKDFEMPYPKFLLQKISHATISMLLAIPLSYLL